MVTARAAVAVIVVALQSCCFSAQEEYSLPLELDGRVLKVDFGLRDELLAVASTFVVAHWPLRIGECPEIATTDEVAQRCVTWHLLQRMLQTVGPALDPTTQHAALTFASSRRHGWAGVAGSYLKRTLYEPDAIVVAAFGLDTDKVAQHGYERLYWRYLPSPDQRDLTILELGGGVGGSLALWRRLYATAHIVLMDVSAEGAFFNGIAFDAKALDDDRVTMLIGDVSVAEDLRRCALASPGYDLIIDDASHVPRHQLAAFKALYGSVKPGGTYIIEDVETSYWRDDAMLYGYKMEGLNLIEYFKAYLAGVVNRETTGGFLSDESIESVTFGSNGIIVTKPRHSVDFASREYRFAGRVKHTTKGNIVIYVSRPERRRFSLFAEAIAATAHVVFAHDAYSLRAAIGDGPTVVILLSKTRLPADLDQQCSVIVYETSTVNCDAYDLATEVWTALPSTRRDVLRDCSFDNVHWVAPGYSSVYDFANHPQRGASRCEPVEVVDDLVQGGKVGSSSALRMRVRPTNADEWAAKVAPHNVALLTRLDALKVGVLLSSGLRVVSARADPLDEAAYAGLVDFPAHDTLEAKTEELALRRCSSSTDGRRAAARLNFDSGHFNMTRTLGDRLLRFFPKEEQQYS